MQNNNYSTLIFTFYFQKFELGFCGLLWSLLRWKGCEYGFGGIFTAAFEQGRRCPKHPMSIYEKYMVITAMHRKKTPKNPIFTGLNIQVHGVGLLFPDIIVLF